MFERRDEFDGKKRELKRAKRRTKGMKKKDKQGKPCGVHAVAKREGSPHAISTSGDESTAARWR
jgi:hypothetical protein